MYVALAAMALFALMMFRDYDSEDFSRGAYLAYGLIATLFICWGVIWSVANIREKRKERERKRDGNGNNEETGHLLELGDLAVEEEAVSILDHDEERGERIGDIMKRASPADFNHAFSYMDKVKTRFTTHPEIYEQFLDIMQTCWRESKPTQDVHAEITSLFRAAPDLVEDFKQFLLETVANTNIQTAAGAATNDEFSS